MDHLNDVNLKVELPDLPTVNNCGGGWSLHDDHVENWAWSSGVFSDSEIDAICEIGSSLVLNKGTTMGGNSELRNSDVSFIFPNEINLWLFQKLAFVINDINSQYFKFDLSSMNQGLQYTEYKAPGQHYGWHIDKGIGMRKLSLSLQLSDPSDYEGGDLQLNIGGEEYITIEKKKGYITVFPSYVLHRVTPVTNGLRKSLVCWVSGPSFR